MYARSNTIQVRQGAMDDAIAMTRDEVWPAIRDMDGCVGLSMMCDRDGNRCIVTTAWQDRAALVSSATGVAPLRQRVRDSFGTGDVDVQEWEIAVLHREHPTSEGACARMTWVRTDPGRADELLDMYRSRLMPRIQAMQGFCSLSMMVDRESGRGVGTVTFADRAALEATREESRRTREEAVVPGVDILDVTEMEVVLAHLRVPETV